MSRLPTWLRTAVVPVLVVLVLVVGGMALYAALAALRPPVPTEAEEVRRLQVEAVPVQPEDAPVYITGYGEVQAIDTVPLMPQVAGEVVAVHPNLEVGALIPAGDVLVRIDEADYALALEQARAQVRQLEQQLRRLRSQYAADRERLETVRRSRDIAKREYETDQELLEEKDIGTQTQVNLSELNYNEAQVAYEQLEQAVSLYPVQIAEAEAGLEAAQASVERAELNLDRTVMRAPFDARLKALQVEVGQYVAPVAMAVTLANDRMLQVTVPIDSRDAATWLPYAGEARVDKQAWFRPVERVTCTIAWTERPEAHRWQGTLNRVEMFNPATRTVMVAIRVTAEQATAPAAGLPLVEGMFCSATIPGRQMRGVYRLPRDAVSFEGDVFIAVDRVEQDTPVLQRRRVELVRSQGDFTFVRGLEPGTPVILTPLRSPLPNTPLDVTLREPLAQVAAGGGAVR